MFCSCVKKGEAVYVFVYILYSCLLCCALRFKIYLEIAGVIYKLYRYINYINYLEFSTIFCGARWGPAHTAAAVC